MSKIKDLEEFDKPREKAERFGIESLKDEELLALIISSGTVGASSLEIARDIINDCRYLSALVNKPLPYFYMYRGVKKANAFKILAVFEIAKRINEKQLFVYEENKPVTSEYLYHRYALKLAGQSQEQLIIVILNKNKQIINEKVVYHGDDNNIPINYRDILRLLMIHNGYYFYLIHNHPNGSSLPSRADIAFTRTINEKAKQLKAKLLDHIIISKNGYFSFLHAQLLQEANKPN